MKKEEKNGKKESHLLVEYQTLYHPWMNSGAIKQPVRMLITIELKDAEKIVDARADSFALACCSSRPSSTDPQDRSGTSLYEENCTPCIGVEGAGIGSVGLPAE